MNISDEKKYIYEMMRDITADRRKLTDMFYELKLRLDELIRLETKGIDEIAIHGIVDLHNARDIKRMTTNIERETQHIIRKIENEAEIKTTPIENPIISKVEIELEKEKVAKQIPTRKGVGMPLEKAAGVIAHVLKEATTPLRVKDLLTLVNERLDAPIEQGNFTKNTLPRSSKLNPKISRASHGYWQYLNN